MTRARRRRAALLVMAACLLVAVWLSLAVGSRPVPPATVLHALSSALGGGAAPAGTDAGVVVDQRLPRTVLGLAAGAALGVSGALVQAVTRNPLADPGVLGVTAGASFAAAVAVGVLGASATGGGVWAALLGALLASVLVQLVGASTSGGRGSPVQLLLAGLALGAVLAGLTSALRLSDPQAFSALVVWESGNLADRGWSGLAAVWPLLAAGLVVALALTPALNAVALGDDLAQALGARVWLVRAASVGAVALLAGGATAAAGPIAFVGLVVPHAVRWAVGPDQRWLVACCAFAAPVLLLLADVVGRVVLRPGELPAGVVTAALGAPVLIALVRRQRVPAP
ncbi:FecCD family ABC transporter permease [Quadrisphaera oryzae]|uniref:FecCD family ABC transporter permease n=1 Tax=Quadrisphaera TaxID=317661 RepID=UPI001648CA8E|nr:iron chelate uptake ABC transporter family permease subunit [Quadrisphaera sp. RL12-1S]MBC3761790.1 iron chelate uptake ABC transporter family permease subunit [Quadrisphaera sp. RL12-1S]